MSLDPKRFDVVFRRGDAGVEGTVEHGFMLDWRATESVPLALVSAEPQLSGTAGKPEGSEESYSVRDVSDFRRILFTDWHGGTGQLTRDQANAIYNKFYESSCIDVSRNGVISLAAESGGIVASDARPVNVTPFCIECGDYVYVACLPEGTGSTNQHQVRYWDNYSEGAMQGCSERLDTTKWPSTAGQRPYTEFLKPITGLDSDQNPKCLATDGEYVYVGLGDDGIWRGNVKDEFEVYSSTADGIIAMAYAGGVLYGVRYNAQDGTTAIGYFAGDAGTATWTEIIQGGVVLKPNVRTVGLVAIGNWVYWGQRGGLRTWVNSAIADDGTGKPQFKLYTELPRGFVGMSLYADPGRLYIGGHFLWPETDRGKGAVYIADANGCNRLCTIGHDPHGEVDLLGKPYDNRVVAMTIWERYLYIITSWDIWRWDLRDGGLSHIAYNTEHPTETMDEEWYRSWTEGSEGSDGYYGDPVTTGDWVNGLFGMRWLGSSPSVPNDLTGSPWSPKAIALFITSMGAFVDQSMAYPLYPIYDDAGNADDRWWRAGLGLPERWQYNAIALNDNSNYLQRASFEIRETAGYLRLGYTEEWERPYSARWYSLDLSEEEDAEDDFPYGLTIQVRTVPGHNLRGRALEIGLADGEKRAVAIVHSRKSYYGSWLWRAGLCFVNSATDSSYTYNDGKNVKWGAYINTGDNPDLSAEHELRLTLKAGVATLYLDDKRIASTESLLKDTVKEAYFGDWRTFYDESYNTTDKTQDGSEFIDTTRPAVWLDAVAVSANGAWPPNTWTEVRRTWVEESNTPWIPGEPGQPPTEIYLPMTTVMDTSSAAVWKGRIFWPVYKKAWMMLDWKRRARQGRLLTSIASGGLPDVAKTMHSLVVVHDPLGANDRIRVGWLLDAFSDASQEIYASDITPDDEGSTATTIPMGGIKARTVGVKVMLLSDGISAGPQIHCLVPRFFIANNRRWQMVIDCREGTPDRTGKPLVPADDIAWLLSLDEGLVVEMTILGQTYPLHIEDLQWLAVRASDHYRGSVDQGRLLLRGRALE